MWYGNETKLNKGKDIFQTKQDHKTSRKLLERLNVFDIYAYLKVSFLGGLIKVSGSAKYLNNQRVYENSSRVSKIFYSKEQDVEIDVEMSTVNPHRSIHTNVRHLEQLM